MSKQYKKSEQETTFNMYVFSDNTEKLIDVINYVNKNTQISVMEGISIHYAKYSLHWAGVSGKTWFKITVSRPFLAFKIGEVYALSSKNLIYGG